MLCTAILIYAAAMTAANLLIAHFGPWVSPINAFVLIGLDLALRDWLHTRMSPRLMLVLIGSSGALTYVLNPGAAHIVTASAAAFVASAAADWWVFARSPGAWLRRSVQSNVVGAAIDTLVFASLAFLVLAPEPKPLAVVAQIALLQLGAKVLGGTAWALALNKCMSPMPRRPA